MAQIAQSGHFAIGRAGDVAYGGMCAWRLAPDETGPSTARSVLTIAMTSLGLGRDLVDAAALAVSELATNSLSHGLRATPSSPIVAPELWMWVRSTPVPQLVVSVYDTCRTTWPDTAPKDLLDEHGKGLNIVSLVSADWGAHPTRSCLQAGTPGKAVWAAFNLPASWPHHHTSTHPMQAARHLASTLTARGIQNVTQHHGNAISLVTIPLPSGEKLNVWLSPTHIAFADHHGTYSRRPTIDLYDTAETLVRRYEQ